MGPADGEARDIGIAEHDPDLVVALESSLPAVLSTGSASAVFVAGSCFHRGAELAGLEVLVDGVAFEPTASAMPRPGLFHELRPPAAKGGPEPDPAGRSFRSGFWARVPTPARHVHGRIEIAVRARLADGRTAMAPLATIEVRDPEIAPAELPAPAAAGGGEDLIAVCMATYEPDVELFAVQIESLRAQSDASWICVISDDCSHPERYEEILETIGGDPRFFVSRSEGRLGFYRNFERALARVPAEAALVALCDQDDRWYPGKLRTLRGSIGSAELVYSDQRLVDRSGLVLRESLWGRRRNNRTNLASMLMANTIVGASALFRRRVLDYALPFPEGPGWQFHDHWLSVVALATGDVAYVDEPLYDYVQHEGAIVSKVGVESAGAGLAPRDRLRRALRPLNRWRAIYFSSYVHLALMADVVLVRCAPGLTRRKRRAASLLASADDSLLALAWLLCRPLREVLRRNETLGTEVHLLKGIAWLWIVRLQARGRRAPDGMRFDTAMPPFDIVGIGQRRLKRWLGGG